MTFLVPAHLRGSRPGDAEAEAGRLCMIAKRHAATVRETGRRSASERGKRLRELR